MAGVQYSYLIKTFFLFLFITQLISDYETDSDVVEMLDNYDFYILALMNADGYEYSFTDVRFCFGVIK